VPTAQMTLEVSELSQEEQEAPAGSLISNLRGHLNEGVQAAREAEIGKRIAQLASAAGHSVGRSASAQSCIIR